MGGSATLVLDDTLFPPSDGKIYGIHTASHGFLSAFLAQPGQAELTVLVEKTEHLAPLRALLRPEVTVRCLGDFDRVPRCAMFYNLPRSSALWNRHGRDSRAYSICGINHSLTGSGAYARMRDILLAPTHPWDAVICTSGAALGVVRRHIEAWADYVGSRGGVAMPVTMQLPVIPLGVDVDAFAPSPEADQAGTDVRRRFGIGADALVVLYLGRLNATSKASPCPMFLGLERAAAQLGRRLHLIQAGWYPSAEMEAETIRFAAETAPSVGLHHLGSVEGAERRAAFAAADIFISLSDNIQETFGLSVVEAMAAGLPVVASDWDGYRDTVEAGVTGVLVPTLMAAPGAGADLGRRHGFMGRAYNRYLLDAAQATAVSIPAVAAAVLALGQDAERRRAMGAAGRARAKRLFDWPVVIGAYAALWDELDAIRRAAGPTPPGADPLHPDPFALFAGFPTRATRPETWFVLAPDWRERLDRAAGSKLLRRDTDALPAPSDIERLVADLDRRGGAAARSLIEAAAPLPADSVQRALVWLAKCGVTLFPD